MPHNDYASPNGQWPDELALEPSRLRALDQNVSEGIDGDAGGTWAPDKPIIIGGSGLNLANGLTVATLETEREADEGPLVVSGAAVAKVTFERSVVIPLRNESVIGDDWDAISYGQTVAGATLDANDNFITTVDIGRIANGNFEVKLHFAVGTKPGSIPAAMPGFWILARDLDEGVTVGSSLYTIPTRANSTDYAVGDLVIPSTKNGRQFRCVTAGTSGAAQPATFGTASIGDGVSDGTVIWVCETGPALLDIFHAVRLPRPTSVDDYYKHGSTQTIEVSASELDELQDPVLAIVVVDDSGTNNVFRALELSFSGASI